MHGRIVLSILWLGCVFGVPMRLTSSADGVVKMHVDTDDASGRVHVDSEYVIEKGLADHVFRIKVQGNDEKLALKIEPLQFGNVKQNIEILQVIVNTYSVVTEHFPKIVMIENGHAAHLLDEWAKEVKQLLVKTPDDEVLKKQLEWAESCYDVVHRQVAFVYMMGIVPHLHELDREKWPDLSDDLKHNMREILASDMENLGKIVATDFFMGNTDRFAPNGGFSVNIVNPKNVFISCQHSDCTSGGFTVGIDMYDATGSYYRDYFVQDDNTQTSFELWTGEYGILLTDLVKMREYFIRMFETWKQSDDPTKRLDNGLLDYDPKRGFLGMIVPLKAQIAFMQGFHTALGELLKKDFFLGVPGLEARQEWVRSARERVEKKDKDPSDVRKSFLKRYATLYALSLREPEHPNVDADKEAGPMHGPENNPNLVVVVPPKKRPLMIGRHREVDKVAD